MNSTKSKIALALCMGLSLGTVACASTLGQDALASRTIERRGKPLEIAPAPRVITSGVGVLHVYSRVAGAAVVVVPSAGDASQACASKIGMGRRQMIEADRSVKIAMDANETACLVGDSVRRTEIFWHTHAFRIAEPAIVAIER